MHSRAKCGTLSATIAVLFALLPAPKSSAELIELNLLAIGNYINTPTWDPATGILTFYNYFPAGPQNLLTGVGVTYLPEYHPGDTLQWALLMATGRPGTLLNISVRNLFGDDNTLSTVNEMSGTTEFQWVLSPPRVIDSYQPYAFFWIPGKYGQHVYVKSILIGDPESIAAHISGVPEPGSVTLLVLGGVGLALAGWRRLQVRTSDGRLRS